MIKPYTYGEPIETEESYILEYGMDKYDHLYGLGENIRSINKRVYIYESS